MSPKVTFVVPCYNLAHFLADCMRSILEQTYEDFELLIMDDCSPDATPQVVQSFHDPRIVHVRNPVNLGHLHNYNKGIELARGEYVWLISADDLLWRKDALARYVEIMDRHPNAGYAFCPAVELRGTEAHLAKYSIVAGEDTIFQGQELLKRLLYANAIVAVSGMVRKRVYQKLGGFPADLPYAGDWYLWCLFALHYDVAYTSETLVAYRIHGESMTDIFTIDKVRVCAEDDIAVPWRILRKAEEAGIHDLVPLCRRAIAYEYARQLRSKRYRSFIFQRSEEEVRSSILQFTTNRREQLSLFAQVYVSLGDLQFQAGGYVAAFESYRRALTLNPALPQLWAKLLLLSSGRLGIAIRREIARRHFELSVPPKRSSGSWEQCD